MTKRINLAKFSASLKETGLYTKDFIRRMEESELDVKYGKTKEYSAESFRKSL